MIRPSRVIFVDKKREQDFYQLTEEKIRKSFIKTIRVLRRNACFGILIAKKSIPKIYIKKYGVNNLWKVSLGEEWKLFYTVAAENELELTTIILDWKRNP